MKKPLNLPRFASEEAERAFWDEADLSAYLEPGDFQRVSFPNLKPSTETISLRLPLDLLEHIKVEAHKRDVPYQSYIKLKLSELLGSSSAA
jgi:predicted DNA binding CopG/RHH family protein